MKQVTVTIVLAVMLALAVASSISASAQSKASAQTMTNAVDNFSQYSTKGPRWTVEVHPASGQATATKAAVAGVLHVADTICFSAAATSAPAATALNVFLRDSTTGAGNILWSMDVFAAASVGQLVPPFCVTDLNIPGVVGNAMTLQFNAALTNMSENVTLVGYSVQ